jgi:hypothetical protein
LDDETLLIRVKKGERIPEQDLALVRERLAAPFTSQDKYTLLHILWKSHDLKAKDVVVLHLGDSDEMVRRIAVQAFTELWPSEEAFQIARRMRPASESLVSNFANGRQMPPPCCWNGSTRCRAKVVPNGNRTTMVY